MVMRPGLGLTLQNLLAPQQAGFIPQQPNSGTPPYVPPMNDEPIQFPAFDPTGDTSFQANVKKPGFLAPGSKSAMIAGILGDALATAGGGQAVVVPQMFAERQNAQRQKQEDIQWSRRQQAENDQWLGREQFKRDHPEPSAMDRNLQTWQAWTPEQRQAYSAMQEAQSGDRFVTTVLPDGRFYAGPQKGLADALTGQGAPAAPATPRRLGPVVNSIPGGPTQPASGGFQR
jgi:hypothetical protein